MRRSSKAFILTLILLAILGTTGLSAQQLDNCTVNTPSPNATLPFNSGTNTWPAGLNTWLSTRQASEFDYQGRSTEIVPTWITYGPYQQLTDFTSSGQCESDLGSSPNWTLAQKRHIEQFYLFRFHRGTPNWAEEFFNIAPQRFTLTSILDDFDCEAMTPNMLWNGTPAMFAEWDYPGNPFYSDPIVASAIRKRLGVWLALQLIMLEDAAWDKHLPGSVSPPTNRFDHPYIGVNQTPAYQVGLADNAELGIALMGLASAYSAIQGEPWFTGQLAQDFTNGLLTQAERLDLVGYWAFHANRLTPAVVGQQMVYNATLDSIPNQPSADDWYLDALHEVFTARYFEAGYLTQDFRYDPGYTKMDSYQVVRLLENHDPNLNGGWPLLELYAAAVGIHDLKAHMTFADWTGAYHGPSAMGTRLGSGANGGSHGSFAYDSTGAGGFRVQAQPYAGELALPFADATIRDEPDFGLYGVRGYAPYTRLVDPLDPNRDFHSVLSCRAAGTIQTSNVWPPATESVPWPALGLGGYYVPHTLIFNHQVPASGSLFKKRALRIENQPETRLMPFELPGPYLRNFDDEIIFAKYGGSGVWGEQPWGHCPKDYDQEPAELGYYSGGASDLAAIVHVGPVSSHDDSFVQSQEDIIGVFGYGGGQLAGLWSPSTGVALLNRRLGRNYDTAATDDHWSDWRQLPIHASTLLTANDVWTSSSRIIDPSPTVLLTDEAPTFRRARAWLDAPTLPAVNQVAEDDAVSSLIEVHGQLPSSGYEVLSTNPNGQVATALAPNETIDYRRRFVVTPRIVFVRTSLTPNTGGGSPTLLKEAWETIPLFTGAISFGNNPVVPWGAPPCEFGAGSGQILEQTSRIEFVTTGGAILDMTNSQVPVPSVHLVRLYRHEGVLTVYFDSPQTVRLSGPFIDQSALPAGDHRRRFQLQNLMIDLRPPGASSSFALPPVDLSYRFSFSASQVGGGDPSGGAPQN